MGRVDMAWDQLHKNYSYSNRNYKWEFALWHYYKDACLVNAHIIYRQSDRVTQRGIVCVLVPQRGLVSNPHDMFFILRLYVLLAYLFFMTRVVVFVSATVWPCLHPSCLSVVRFILFLPQRGHFLILMPQHGHFLILMPQRGIVIVCATCGLVFTPPATAWLLFNFDATVWYCFCLCHMWPCIPQYASAQHGLVFCHSMKFQIFFTCHSMVFNSCSINNFKIDILYSQFFLFYIFRTWILGVPANRLDHTLQVGQHRPQYLPRRKPKRPKSLVKFPWRLLPQQRQQPLWLR